MSELVSYRREGAVAVIEMDDGKVNAVGLPMIAALNAALDRAESEGAAIVLTGRAQTFCGGFDLRVMKSAGLDTLKMLRGGFELSARMLAFPRPIVVACNGHAVAMGAFLVLSGDYRLGARGPFKLQANEVAIGMTLPRAAIAICRQRIAPQHLDRVTLLSEAYDPEGAVAAGFLDRVVDAEALLPEALAIAERLATGLDATAHARTKARLRADTVRAIRSGASADLRELALLGVRRTISARLGN